MTIFEGDDIIFTESMQQEKRLEIKTDGVLRRINNMKEGCRNGDFNRSTKAKC